MDDSLALAHRTVGHAVAREPPEIDVGPRGGQWFGGLLLDRIANGEVELELHDTPPWEWAKKSRRRGRRRCDLVRGQLASEKGQRQTWHSGGGAIARGGRSRSG